MRGVKLDWTPYGDQWLEMVADACEEIPTTVGFPTTWKKLTIKTFVKEIRRELERREDDSWA